MWGVRRTNRVQAPDGQSLKSTVMHGLDLVCSHQDSHSFLYLLLRPWPELGRPVCQPISFPWNQGRLVNLIQAPSQIIIFNRQTLTPHRPGPDFGCFGSVFIPACCRCLLCTFVNLFTNAPNLRLFHLSRSSQPLGSHSATSLSHATSVLRLLQRLFPGQISTS